MNLKEGLKKGIDMIQAEIIRAEKDGVEPLLTSEDYKAIIDLIKEHRQSEKEMHVNKHGYDYER